MRYKYSGIIFIFSLIVSLAMTGCKNDSKSTKSEENNWSVYKSDAASSNYSSSDQINVSNVNNLKLAWTYKIQDMPEDARPASSQSNPIVVDGILYATSGKQLTYALDAATGEEIWSFDPFDGGEGGGVSRGVTYWEDGEDKRILLSVEHYLIAVDAKTGKKISEFGNNGVVDLNIGVRENPEMVSISSTSPGIVYEDLIIMGSRVPDAYGSKPGNIRAYNCRTGKLEWSFNTIPKPGEKGYKTWPQDAYKYAGGVNAWAGLSLDKERGIVYLALGSPTYDFYGANRKGKNLYGNCVLALNAETGEYVWHYQIVHHDLWDYDLPAPTNLVTLEKEGEIIEAVAQVTKHGFVFVLDRETGEPIFPVEEREVPPSNIPGEEAWPTQPYPLKPAPFALQKITEEDLSNYTEAAHDSLIAQFRSMRYEGLFTPPDLDNTIMLPGTRGGAEWGGAAFDPATNYLYIRSNNAPDIITMKKLEPNNANPEQEDNLLSEGRTIYMNYCASCHGQDMEGTEVYPSLVGMNERLSAQNVLNKVKNGVGVMPGFATVIEGQEDAIMAYIYGLTDVAEQQTSTSKQVDQENEFDRYINTTGYITWTGPSGKPAIKAPWGTLNALNLSTGEYEWQIPLGNDEDLQEEKELNTGLEGKSGPVVTAGGLIFISGSTDKKLRAFNKSNGELLWETTLPGMNNATVSTYMINGKQYVALLVGGNEENPSGFIQAYSLE